MNKLILIFAATLPVLSSCAEVSGSSPSVAPIPESETTTYQCNDGRVVSADFENDAERVVLRSKGAIFARLNAKPAASGIWYEGQGYTLRGKGAQANLTGPDGRTFDCVSN
ncbi:MliC family protein [Agrobacterium sp. T29]|uniref:MliC family protein n=1 Tax=Agrobacterium sp. T29 TaxID=2580515 RepID=UPI00115C5DAE